MAKNTITRKALKAAPAIGLNIAGQLMSAAPREFSTGSLGWFGNGKVTVLVDGQPVVCQVSCNITAVGSKDAAEE